MFEELIRTNEQGLSLGLLWTLPYQTAEMPGLFVMAFVRKNSQAACKRGRQISICNHNLLIMGLEVERNMLNKLVLLLSSSLWVIWPGHTYARRMCWAVPIQLTHTEGSAPRKK